MTLVVWPCPSFAPAGGNPMAGGWRAEEAEGAEKSWQAGRLPQVGKHPMVG